MRKLKLSAEQQIAHLRSKGIRFNLISEADALKYLQGNNNYFKLRAYRKVFNKRPDGTYFSLDFGHLKDLSIIDMRLRNCILLMCLDIEHFAKVYLMKSFDQSVEDGYKIVRDFTAENPTAVNSAFESARKSPYCRDLYSKYISDMPIWVFIELIGFGLFIRFFQFYAQRSGDTDMINFCYHLMTIRQVRNAAAHNNCILNDLSANTAEHNASYEIMRYLGTINMTKTTRNHKMSCERIRQIVTLLYTYNKLMPSYGVRTYRAQELHNVMRRVHDTLHYYQGCPMLYSSFVFLITIVDNLFPHSV